MEKVYIAPQILRVEIEDKFGNPVTQLLHDRDAGKLIEKTKEGDSQRTFYCPRCCDTFHAPLEN